MRTATRTPPPYLGSPVPDLRRLRQLVGPTAAAPISTPIDKATRTALELAGFTVPARAHRQA